MTNRAQSRSFNAFKGALDLRGPGLAGLRLRLTRELPAGSAAARLALRCPTTGQLLLQSGVIS